MQFLKCKWRIITHSVYSTRYNIHQWKTRALWEQLLSEKVVSFISSILLGFSCHHKSRQDCFLEGIEDLSHYYYILQWPPKSHWPWIVHNLATLDAANSFLNAASCRTPDLSLVSGMSFQFNTNSCRHLCSKCSLIFTEGHSTWDVCRGLSTTFVGSYNALFFVHLPLNLV